MVLLQVRTCSRSIGHRKMTSVSSVMDTKRVQVMWLHATGLSGQCYQPLACKINNLLDVGFPSGRRISLVHHFPDQRSHGQAPPYSSPRCVWHEDNVDDVVLLAGKVKKRDKAPLFVIGHSMGAAVAMYSEARTPAPLFTAGGILLEPIVPNYLLKLGSFIAPNPLVASAKRKITTWSNRDEARHYFSKRRSHWNPEFVEAFLNDCLTETGEGSTVQRRCAPEIEARTMSLLGPIIGANDFKANSCGSWQILAGETTKFPPFVGGTNYFRKLAKRYGAGFDVIPSAAHFAPMENPEAVAAIAATQIASFCLTEGGGHGWTEESSVDVG